MDNFDKNSEGFLHFMKFRAVSKWPKDPLLKDIRVADSSLAACFPEIYAVLSKKKKKKKKKKRASIADCLDNSNHALTGNFTLGPSLSEK